jgi:hypothetical protein
MEGVLEFIRGRNTPQGHIFRSVEGIGMERLLHVFDGSLSHLDHPFKHLAHPQVDIMPPGGVYAPVFQGLSGTDLVAGEASHAVSRFYRHRNFVTELIDMHRTVFHAETTPITGVRINMDIYHRLSPYRKIYS